MSMFQMVEGKFEEIEESCVKHAYITFQRRTQDKNRKIVQMVSRGTAMSHYYFRSDQWIEQPYAFPDQHIDAYCGPPIGDIRADALYSIEDYLECKAVTDLAYSDAATQKFTFK